MADLTSSIFTFPVPSRFHAPYKRGAGKTGKRGTARKFPFSGKPGKPGIVGWLAFWTITKPAIWISKEKSFETHH